MKSKYTRSFILFGFIFSFQYVVSQPLIISVAPDSVYAGSEITITGAQLLGITQIKLGNPSISLANIGYNTIDTLVLSIPPNTQHSTYKLILTSNVSEGNAFALTVLGPSISAVTPQNQETDHRITIHAAHVDSILAVKFGGKPADLNSIIYLNGTSEFSIEVPYVNAVGNYSIEIDSKFDFTEPFAFSISGLNIPQITDIQPSSASVGDLVTLFGINIGSISGVIFGNTLAQFSSITLIDSQSFTVQVPFLSPGDNSVKIFTPRGESNAADFQIKIATPVITSFLPSAAKIGDPVTVSGTNLQYVNAIIIGTITTSGIQLISTNNLSFIIPNGATSSSLTILSIYGNNESENQLEVDTITTVRGGTTASIYDFDSKLNDIKIINSDRQLLSLELYNDYKYLIISDILGKIIFKSENISKGRLEIPFAFSVGNLFLLGENNGGSGRKRIFIQSQ